MEGKVGFKTYKNYFTAGADWSVIIFLILVNIVAQVRKGVYFGWCTQFDMFSSVQSLSHVRLFAAP